MKLLKLTRVAAAVLLVSVFMMTTIVSANELIPVGRVEIEFASSYELHFQENHEAGTDVIMRMQTCCHNMVLYNEAAIIERQQISGEWWHRIGYARRCASCRTWYDPFNVFSYWGQWTLGYGSIN